jgi:hypothetical protein
MSFHYSSKLPLIKLIAVVMQLVSITAEGNICLT